MAGISIDHDRLERWALAYLERYASSAANLRRVLLRRVRRELGPAPGGDTALREATALIDALIARYCESALLDDNAYAAARVQALHRRGGSLRAIRAGLAAKGIAGATATDAITALRDSSGDPDLAAACAFARRRRLGPYRRTPDLLDRAARERALAVFARGGFSRRVAETVLACPDVASAEALAAGDAD